MVKKYTGLLFTIVIVLAVVLISVQTAFAMQLSGLNVTLTCSGLSYGIYTIFPDRDNTGTGTVPGTGNEAFYITVTDGQGTLLHEVGPNQLSIPGPHTDGPGGSSYNQGATALDNVRIYTWVSLAGNGFLQEPVYSTTNPDCTGGAPTDSDGDGVPDGSDQCPGFDDNIDVDNDGIPDGCDGLIDSDGDGVADSADQCPGFDDNVDVDNDGVPDGCDGLIDSDGDGVADSADQCPGQDDTIDANTNGTPDCLEGGDSDGDGVPDGSDQCPGQDDTIDANTNGVPDCAESPTDDDDNQSDANDDRDGDGIGNSRDNCPDAYNPSQEDGWGSAMGDACDTDWYNLTGIGVAGFEQKSGEYHVHGNCTYMADGDPRCPEVASFNPATFRPDSMPMEVTTEQAGTWSVWVYFLYSSDGVDVYQVNVYSTNPPQPDTLVDDRLEIHVNGGSWQWYQRGGSPKYNGN